jgi:hypothetical protein
MFIDRGSGLGINILNFEWYLTLTLILLKQKTLNLVLLDISPQEYNQL